MHECKYCGDVNCTKRACIEAIWAMVDYWEEEARTQHDAGEPPDQTVKVKP